MTLIKYLFITLTLLVMNAYLLNSDISDKNVCNDNSCLHRSLQQDIESILLAKANNFSVKNDEDSGMIALTLEQLEMMEDIVHTNNSLRSHVATIISSSSTSNTSDKSVNTIKVKHVNRVKMLDNSDDDNNASKTNNNYNVNEEGKCIRVFN